MSTKRPAEEEAAGAEKKQKDDEPAYLALPIVPSIISHGAEKHMQWVLDHIPTAKQMGELFKNDKGELMHGVISLTNKHATQHVYFGDADCDMGMSEENKKSMLAVKEYCKGLQLHMNFDDVDVAKAGFKRATEDGNATVLMPFEPAFWGSMFGLLRDPFGFVWAFCSNLPPKEGEGAKEEEESK